MHFPQVTLTWLTVEPAGSADVYLSTATGTACNSGYFGAQFHPVGSPAPNSVLFSMWDNPQRVGRQNHTDFPFQAVPASDNCWRNALDSSGKSTGVQCGQPWAMNKSASQKVSFKFGASAETTPRQPSTLIAAAPRRQRTRCQLSSFSFRRACLKTSKQRMLSLCFFFSSQGHRTISGST